MERSPQYDQAVAQIKQEHHDGSSLEESSEKLGLLRMEMILDNAQCARLLTQYIENNPAASKDDFVEYAQSTGLIIHPEIAKSFIDALCIARDRTDRAFAELKNKGKSPDQIGDRLFSWIAHDQRKRPKMPVSVNASYPLSVIATLQEEDFDQIDPRYNVGGFYCNELEYEHKKLFSTNEDVFPVIAVRESKSEYWSLKSHKMYSQEDAILQHEKGHAENHAFNKAVESKVVWTRILPETEDLYLNAPESALNETEINWKYIMQQALAHGKDELLAQFKSSVSVDSSLTSSDSEEFLQILLQRGGNYDYFKKYGIDHESDAYHILWQKYSEILTSAFNIVKEVTDIYDNGFRRLKERSELLRWVLAQFPINKWREGLEKGNFIIEAKALEKTKEDYDKIWESNNPELAGLARLAFFELLDKCESNQSKPFWQYIKEFNDKLDIK